MAGDRVDNDVGPIGAPAVYNDDLLEAKLSRQLEGPLDDRSFVESGDDDGDRHRGTTMTKVGVLLPSG